MTGYLNDGGDQGEQSGGPRSVVADSIGGRDRARPSKGTIPTFQYSNIPVTHND